MTERFEQVVITGQIPRVEAAPARSLLSVKLLRDAIRMPMIGGDTLHVGNDEHGDPVLYRIVGWSAPERALIIERVTDSTTVLTARMLLGPIVRYCRACGKRGAMSDGGKYTCRTYGCKHCEYGPGDGPREVTRVDQEWREFIHSSPSPYLPIEDWASAPDPKREDILHWLPYEGSGNGDGLAATACRVVVPVTSILTMGARDELLKRASWCSECTRIRDEILGRD